MYGICLIDNFLIVVSLKFRASPAKSLDFATMEYVKDYVFENEPNIQGAMKITISTALCSIT